MPNFDEYWTVVDAIDAASRAVDAWNRIQANPTTITLQGAASAIVVRIEHDGKPSARNGDAGRGNLLGCTVFGVRDHPADGVADTVIAQGSRFAVDGNLYEVKRVITPPGEIQAFAESV